MAAKWVSYSLVPGGGNFYTLPDAKREAQIEANRRDMEVQIHSVKHDGNYLVSGSAKFHGTFKPRKSNPTKGAKRMNKYKVTVQVDAPSARAAKEMVASNTRSNPNYAVMDPSSRYAASAQLRHELHSEGISEEREEEILTELRKIDRANHPVKKKASSQQRLRDMEYPIIMGGYLLDKKTLTPIRRALTPDEVEAIEQDRIRRYGV